MLKCSLSRIPLLKRLRHLFRGTGFAKVSHSPERLLPEVTPKTSYPPADLPVVPPTFQGSLLLSGKNVLITGAGRNIGESIALEMAQQGANIFFTELDPTRHEQLLKKLADYPVRSSGFLCNSSCHQEIDQLCQTLETEQITIDILVNNAALQINKDAVNQLSIQDWQQSFEANVVGPLYLTQRIAQRMIKQGIAGSIIFMTSIHQWETLGQPSYSSSKAALGMAIQELAVELSAHGIRVNGIAPGWVKETEKGHPIPAKHALLHQTSIRPAYIGRAAVYLAADYFSHFTTGTILKIDAGLSLCHYRVAKSRLLI